MATAKPSTARRRDVRKSVPRPRSTWRAVLRRRETVWALTFGTALVLIGGITAMIGSEQPRHFTGEVLHENFIPRVSFSSPDHNQTYALRHQAREATPPIFSPNLAYRESLRARLLGVIKDIANEPQEAAKRYRLSEAETSALSRAYVNDGRVQDAWHRKVDTFLNAYFSLAVLDPAIRRELDQQERDVIVLYHPSGTATHPNVLTRRVNAWLKTSERDGVLENVWPELLDFPEALQNPIQNLVRDGLSHTYAYDDALTQAARDVAADAVPQATRVHAAQDVLITAGTRLDAADVGLLELEHNAFIDDQPPVRRVLRALGYFGLTLLVALGLWLYVLSYKPRIARNPMRGLALTSLLLGCQITAVVAAVVWPWFVLGAVTAPTLLAAMVLTIAYDRRFALAVGSMLAVLTALSLSLSVALVMVLFAGVVTTVLQLGEVKSRSKLLMTGLFSGLSMAGAALVASLATQPPLLDPALLSSELLTLVQDGVVHVIIAGFITGLFVQGVLPLVEKAFNITTAMTLRELNDASHPLLQRLAQEAPGTYQHSLRIADMAEAAADRIGADGLLCRVGAMYHDIGKINKPSYFIENQGGGPNKHAKLSPAMSLLIIVGHVKDGVEMAKEFGLPPVVRHFIESHHGTSLVEYFYHAAKKKKEAQEQPAPKEFEFRYPGPKPQTKEAAIMLLCDSLEAAARALPEPTPVRLEQLVHSIANKRLMDNQFDACEMTLRDLAQIEEAIIKTLCAVYHTRIKYPSDKPLPTPAGSTAGGAEARPPRLQGPTNPDATDHPAATQPATAVG